MSQELNPQQKRAVEAPPGPLLIIAGAGTGKTKTLTSRLIHLIENDGVNPGEICALTFTNKASREMQSRVERSLSPKLRELFVHDPPFIGTFHSLGAKILRHETSSIGRRRNFVIFDDHDSFALIKKIMKREGKEVKPSQIASGISRIKNGVVNIVDLAESQKSNEKILYRAFETYESSLREYNAFDFDDLIQKVVWIFQNEPKILERYEKKFRYILVDEYQDVNPKQYELIRLLGRGHRNVNVVGDDHQMIYGWRYANLEIFLGFDNDWPGATTVMLEENYRSTADILRGASAIIQHNRRQKPKELWTKNGGGSPIKLIETGNEEEEARWIVSKILTLERQTTSIAILYRTNAQSRAIEQALIEEGISYRIFGGIKFYERLEVRDIVAALRYASNPSDEISNDRLKKNFSKKIYHALAENILPLADGSPVDVIKKFIEVTDYIEWLDKNFENNAERRENIGELIHFASRFEKIPEFLEEIALLQTTDSSSKKNVAGPVLDSKNKPEMPVELMTIHLAKGLEFDIVFVAGCSEGLLPHARSLENEDTLEEERRLMYVAMTRARRDLYLSFYDVPSRFLSEMPEDGFEFTNLISDKKSLDDEERYISLD